MCTSIPTYEQIQQKFTIVDEAFSHKLKCIAKATEDESKVASCVNENIMARERR